MAENIQCYKRNVTLALAIIEPTSLISEIRGIVGDYRAVSWKSSAALEPVILCNIRRVLAALAVYGHSDGISCFKTDSQQGLTGRARRRSATIIFRPMSTAMVS